MTQSVFYGRFYSSWIEAVISEVWDASDIRFVPYATSISNLKFQIGIVSKKLSRKTGVINFVVR